MLGGGVSGFEELSAHEHNSKTHVEKIRILIMTVKILVCGYYLIFRRGIY